MRILGIDPGLGVTGYGILDADGDDVSVVEAGVVRSDSRQPLASRLLEIAREIGEVMAQFHPGAVAIEDLYSHYGHPKTAIIMGHARGIVLLKVAEAGLPVFPYASTRIKKSLTGNGRASKKQMQLMIASTLGLTAIPEPPDVADALAVALCHCRAREHNHAVSV
ncbi:MAG: crossover junction endodeoxyribonuclease RuvC [candidate division Zixibacteria bacterium]|nr:crossover junction endodeoxyribonuclease RuvC [candidate division Zixibacteria bacterium]